MVKPRHSIGTHDARTEKLTVLQIGSSMCRFLLFLTLLLATGNLRGQEQQQPRVLNHPSSERRVALVIGNANYQPKENVLDNPVNDARLMTKTLQSLGFDVTEGEDLTKEQTNDLIQKFKKRLIKGCVALFYYAGHGVQYRGANFMIPTNVVDLREETIQDQAVDVNFLIDEMAEAETDVNLIILDACRGNLTTRSWLTRREGFAGIAGPKGTVIAYSTSAGRVADDGRGRQHSPYAEALARWMTQGCLKIEDVFKHVRADVWAASGKKQLTWESGSLIGDFFLAGTGCSSGVVAASSLTDRDSESAAQTVLLDNENLVVKIGDDKSHNEYMGPISDRIIANGLKVVNSTSLPARDRAQLNGFFLEGSRTRDKTGLQWLPYPLILRIFAVAEDLESQLIGQSTSEARIWIRVYRTDTAEEVELYSNSQIKARGYGTTKEQARYNALRAAAQQIPNTFFDSVGREAKLVRLDSRSSSVVIVEPKTLETNENPVLSSNSSGMDRSRRVLLAVKPPLLSSNNMAEQEAFVKEFSVPFLRALAAVGLTADDSVNLDDRDRVQLEGDLHPRVRRETVKTSPQPNQVLTPLKRNLSWLPYRLVIEVSLRSRDSEEYLGRFMTEASVQITVYLTKNGDMASYYSNYQDKTRGYGSSKTQAQRNAIRAAAQGIPEKFIKEIADDVKK